MRSLARGGPQISGTSGAAAVETAHVNKSLHALSRVLLGTAHHSLHIPYRDSALTKLLMRSFESDRTTNVLVACVSPAASMLDESINTLSFAKRACAQVYE